MQEKIFADGAVIYADGAASDAVYVIQRGEVRILRAFGNEFTELKVLGPGQIFGESGVIQSKPRSTAVRAKGEVTVLCVTAEEFLSAFGSKNPFSLPLLRMLCERLSEASQRIAEISKVGRDIAKVGEFSTIALLAASKEVEFQIGTEGVEVAELPFVAGGKELMSGGPLVSPNRLCLRATKGRHIADAHFTITEKAGQLVVEDLGGKYGTEVNGHAISHANGDAPVPLWIGENRIVAGGEDSPYRFSVVVGRAGEQKSPEARPAKTAAA